MKKKNKRVIPGFGISMGVTLTMVSVIVLIPLATLVIYTAQMSFPEIIATITRGRVLSSFYVSFITAFAASAINAVMGLILAWVLVRYEFPGKRILDGMIELPFALPTAVAGISLTYLTTDSGWIGSFFAKFGIQIAYTRLGITFALIFVGIPFVVRSIQPVLEKLDPSYEEAASVLGASRTRIFWKVIFPEVLPSLCTGFGLAFGRCLGEYGSIVFIAQAVLHRDYTVNHYVGITGIRLSECNGDCTGNADSGIPYFIYQQPDTGKKYKNIKRQPLGSGKGGKNESE